MHVTLARAAIAACALAFASAASAAADNVLSANVKEADGTSGQDTNVGSGVKTGHLQDGAVTAPKLADGAVAGPKLAPAAVGTAAIADGAVTDAKIAGPISAMKIDGLEAIYSKRIRNIVVVAKDGSGDFSDPVAALASITDASEANPYLVRIAPGEYTLSTPLVMKEWVDLEGSGQGVTRLVVGAVAAPRFALSANSEVRALSIRAFDEYAVSAGFAPGPVRLTDVSVHLTATIGGRTISGIATSSTDVVLTRVTLRVDAADSVPVGLSGVNASGATTLTLRDCDVQVVGGSGGNEALRAGILSDVWNSRLLVSTPSSGAYGIVGSARLRNSTLEIAASWAYGLIDGDYELSNSEISAGEGRWAIRLVDGRTLRAANSKIVGIIQKLPTAVASCVGLYDAAYAPITCP